MQKNTDIELLKNLEKLVCERGWVHHNGSCTQLYDYHGT